MEQTFDIVIEQDESGLYVADVPALPGCHTQAKDLESLRTRIREAILLCLEAERPADIHLVGVEQVTVSA